jgi:phenylpropionate dioxygenase-like ring-hydroxylating dioxygenase large terminal subunit
MYPFTGDGSYIRNRWYIAAFSADITGTPFERTILDTPIAFYRAASGQAVAMYGLCPHRYYPLALGKVEDDALVCGYHGFTFASNGKCIRIPAQGTGAGFVQPTYPLVEKGSLTWIWLGDAGGADPALIPPYEDFGLDQPGWTACANSHFLMKGRSQLLVDNLMDLTHLPFIHHQIPGGDVLLQTRFEIEERPASYRLKRLTQSPWTGFHDMLFGANLAFEGLSDMQSLTDFYGPELIRTSGPITTRIDGLTSVPAGIGVVYFIHGITPKTATSAHYFGLATRNFRLDDPALDALLSEMDPAVRAQDVTAIEAVERRLDQGVARQQELLAKADGPAIAVRKIIQKMLDKEAS